MLPPLQPTTRSNGMFSRCSTFHMPTAAAHFIPPDPTTTASLGRRSTVAACSGTRALQQAVQVVELRLGGQFALADHVREAVGVEQADRPVELRQYRDDLGVVREVVERIVRAQ